MGLVTLQEAMLYCRWLTARDGMDESQQCYRYDQEKFDADEPVRTTEAYLDKTGYRILTEPEWEFACRAGTTTSRYFGDEIASIQAYSWGKENTGNHAMPPGLLRRNWSTWNAGSNT
jgi:formylglycine-generating enzyme required for sulfatase activity